MIESYNKYFFGGVSVLNSIQLLKDYFDLKKNPFRLEKHKEVLK